MYVLALCIFQTNFKCMNEWMNENIPEIDIIDISFAWGSRLLSMLYFDWGCPKIDCPWNWN